MNKKVIWIVGFLLWINLLSAKKKIRQVYLEVIDQPIVFGESVQLFCNLSLVPDCCSNTVTWMRNISVIVHHGTSVDASKYAQIPAQTGFSLQINHFAETDLYTKFACLYGFNVDSIVFGMNKNKYERHPSSDEIRIDEYLDKKNNVFVTDIVFERVLPMPSCILLSNDRDLEATFGIKKHNIGMFYNVSIQLKLNNIFDDCPNNITLKCSIGGYNMRRALKHVIPCSEVPYNNSDHKNDAEVIIMICLLIVVLLSVVIIILRLRHVYLSSKRQRQGDKLVSIKTDQRGLVLESKASTETHGQMNKCERQESVSLLAAHEQGERQEAISLLEAHERGDRLESIETDEQDESLDSTALLETCDLGPVLESKASMETHEEMNKYNFIPMPKDRQVRERLTLKKKKKKEKKLGPVLESKASTETHEQMNKSSNARSRSASHSPVTQKEKDNFIPMQKDRHVRERLKLKKKKKKEKNSGPVLELKASMETHEQMNKSSNARSWSASHSPVTQKEKGERLESMETDEQGPVLESKASMETQEEINKSSNARSRSASHSPVTQKEKGPVLESKASMETQEEINKYNFIPIQKDRHLRERLKLEKKGKKEENLVEGKKIPFLKEKLGKVE